MSLLWYRRESTPIHPCDAGNVNLTTLYKLLLDTPYPELDLLAYRIIWRAHGAISSKTTASIPKNMRQEGLEDVYASQLPAFKQITLRAKATPPCPGTGVGPK